MLKAGGREATPAPQPDGHVGRQQAAASDTASTRSYASGKSGVLYRQPFQTVTQCSFDLFPTVEVLSQIQYGAQEQTAKVWGKFSSLSSWAPDHNLGIQYMLTPILQNYHKSNNVFTDCWDNSDV